MKERPAYKTPSLKDYKSLTPKQLKERDAHEAEMLAIKQAEEARERAEEEALRLQELEGGIVEPDSDD